MSVHSAHINHFPGTHDVREISMTSPSAGIIRITGYFIPDSPAAGVLVAVLNTTEIFFYMLKREGNELHDEGVLSMSEVVSTWCLFLL